MGRRLYAHIYPSSSMIFKIIMFIVIFVSVMQCIEANIYFNEEFTLAAGEDIDFCLKAREAGFSITPLDDHIILHDYGYEPAKKANWQIVKERFVRYGKGTRQLVSHYPNYYQWLQQSVIRITT